MPKQQVSCEVDDKGPREGVRPNCDEEGQQEASPHSPEWHTIQHYDSFVSRVFHFISVSHDSLGNWNCIKYNRDWYQGISWGDLHSIHDYETLAKEAIQRGGKDSTRKDQIFAVFLDIMAVTEATASRKYHFM